MGALATPARIAKILSREHLCCEGVKDPSFEWMVHPGYAGEQWDDFNCSTERELELDLLKSEDVKELICEEGFNLGSFEDL